MTCSVILLFAILLQVVVSLEHTVVFTPEDLTPITLYGSDALYAPDMCPPSVAFTGRARRISELGHDKIGILTSDIMVDGERCESKTKMLDFAPIGEFEYLPSQWVLEDSLFTGEPVYFQCGDYGFSIRYAYLNDVKISGELDRDSLYLDFAVMPYSTSNFSFCSYATRRTDGQTPLYFAPLPELRVWQEVEKLRFPEDEYEYPSKSEEPKAPETVPTASDEYVPAVSTEKVA